MPTLRRQGMLSYAMRIPTFKWTGISVCLHYREGGGAGPVAC